MRSPFSVTFPESLPTTTPLFSTKCSSESLAAFRPGFSMIGSLPSFPDVSDIPVLVGPVIVPIAVVAVAVVAVVAAAVVIAFPSFGYSSAPSGP